FVSESTQAIAPSNGVGWSASGSAQIPLARWGNSRVFFGPGASVRAYISGPSEFDYAVISARMELSHHADRLRAWAGLGASGAWLGWSPYVDAEDLYSGLSWSLGQHALVRTDLSVQRRAAHLVGYDNLDAFGARLAPQLRLGLGGPGWLGVGWTLGAERGNAYVLTWSGTSSDKKPLPYDASLTAESTWTGQGPSLVLRLEPFSDRLELSSSVEFQWRRYGPEEQISYVYPDQILAGSQARRDRRLFVLAGLSGHVKGELWVFLRYSGLRNWSTLTPDVWPIDRSYTRHLVLSGVELRG
ncbi:MAG: hypothetical protein GXP62_09715, partial [Oligoflexia bacterium]|nr:hypothetical protein [Oligoflexia bacterium]